MAATIEGKPAAEWLRAAKERQAKGQYDETGAREAVQRMQGRVMPEYDNKGQIVRGGVGKTYNAKPVPAAPKPKAEPAKAAASPASTAGWNREGWPKTTPPGQPGYKAPEAARKVAEMPKPQTYASAPKAKPAQAPAKPAGISMTQAQREGQERIAKAKVMIDEHLKNTQPKPYVGVKERLEKRYKEIDEESNAEKANKARQRRMDERAATPGPVAAAKGVGTMAADVGGGIASAAKAAKKAVGRQYAGLGSYAASQMEKGKRFYSGVGKWLTGDPEAKKRLAESAK